METGWGIGEEKDEEEALSTILRRGSAERWSLLWQRLADFFFLEQSPFKMAKDMCTWDRSPGLLRSISSDG